jgi:hypothetical protein
MPLPTGFGRSNDRYMDFFRGSLGLVERAFAHALWSKDAF